MGVENGFLSNGMPEVTYEASTGNFTVKINSQTGQTITVPADSVLGNNNILSPYTYSSGAVMTDTSVSIKSEIDILHEQIDSLKTENHDLRGYCNFLYEECTKLSRELEDIKGCITEQQGRVILSKDDSIFKDLLDNMEDSVNDTTGNE